MDILDKLFGKKKDKAATKSKKDHGHDHDDHDGHDHHGHDHAHHGHKH